MKIILTLLLLVFSINSHAQDENISISDFYTFPFNTKFTIKVVPNNSGDFDYNIVLIEKNTKIIENWNHAEIFNKEGDEETLEFCFCHEKNQLDGNELKTALWIKSNSKYSFSFKTEIQTEENGEFKDNFNLGAKAGVITSDRWAKKTYKLKIGNFKKIR